MRQGEGDEEAQAFTVEKGRDGHWRVCGKPETVTRIPGPCALVVSRRA